MNRFIRRFTLIILPLLMSGTAALAQNDAASVLSLTGTSTVNAAPDMANLSSGVLTQAKTAAEALSSNNRAMTQLIAVIKAAGVEDRDMQTSGFSVQPQYVYSNQQDENGYNAPPRIVGYQVSNNLTVRVRALEKLGSVLDKMVSASSNTIGGVSFGVADTKPLLDEARRRAVSNAMDKAKLYSDAAGVCLSGIRSITENAGYTPEPQMMRAMASDFAAESVPVQTGEVGFTMNVSISWDITPAPCT